MWKRILPIWPATWLGITSTIQMFRERLSHKSVKAYTTMPIGIMGRKSLAVERLVLFNASLGIFNWLYHNCKSK